MYPIVTTTQINFTDGDVFPNKAENCCRKYGKLRLKTLSAAIFMTDERKSKIDRNDCHKTVTVTKVICFTLECFRIRDKLQFSVRF